MSRSRWALVLTPLATLIVGLTAAPATASPKQPPATATTKRRPTTSTTNQPRLIVTTAPGQAIAVPPSFFGLSTEYWSIPAYMAQAQTFERVLSLLEVPHEGPTTLRIGGQSADLTYWSPGSFPIPQGAYVLDYGWFQQVAQLVSDLGLRVIFDLNLLRSPAQLSAGLASEAMVDLPGGSVAGFEVGNEPNLYPGGYGTDEYARNFSYYANALSSIAPGVPLLGPSAGDLTPSSTFDWARALIDDDRSQVGELTGHRYGLDPCVPRGFPRYPTVGRVLSDKVARATAAPVAAVVRLAHSAGLHFRIDEMNSVTCGGLPGVSDTYATALWAPDMLFRMLQTRLDALNFHMRPDTINAPFFMTQAGVSTRPLFYGLALFARTLDGTGQVVPLRVAARGSGAGKLDAWGVKVAGQLRVLLINKTARAANAVLRFAATGRATVQQLRGGSPTATSGATLAGQRLGPDGSWVGRRVIQRVRLKDDSYQLSVPAFSAALVTMRLR